MAKSKGKPRANPARDAARELKSKLDATFGEKDARNDERAIDPRIVAGLAAIQCTYEEIAAVVGTSESTVRTKYGAIIEKERLAGRMSLRRAQFTKATKDGNVTMMIWLGKQYLGQKDKHEVTPSEGAIPMLVIRREHADAPLSDGVAAALDGTLGGAL